MAFGCLPLPVNYSAWGTTCKASAEQSARTSTFLNHWQSSTGVLVARAGSTYVLQKSKIFLRSKSNKKAG